MKKQMTLRGKAVRGVTVSNYGLKNGYLDYRTLAQLVGEHILNNTLMEATNYEDWIVLAGNEFNEYDEPMDIYQWYIISENGYRFLDEYTDEIIYYNETLDIYLWAITHFGTSWDYVLTDVELVQRDDMRPIFSRLAEDEAARVRLRIIETLEAIREHDNKFNK